MEYQNLNNTPDANQVKGTFWGKDFLLVDIDNSGPVSIDIPPGTYNGTQLAQAVEIAVREAFGDNKKVQLTPAVDNTFSIDLKKSTGDGQTSGLSSGPITVDLHGASFVATAAEAEAGLEMDTFLSHAQVKMTEAMNTYIQGANPADPDGVNAANVATLGVDGRLFKKLVGGSSVPVAAIPTGNDIITIAHKELDGTGSAAPNTQTTTPRFIAYSNSQDTTSTNYNRPEVKAYDLKATMNNVAGNYGVTAGVHYISVPKTDFSLTPETVRFMQFPAVGKTNALTTFFGTEDIAVSSVVQDPVVSANYRVSLTFDMGTATALPVLSTATEAPIFVLAKPSDNIAAYFEGTEGLVEGVDDAFYTGKIVFQEIGTSAKRLAAQSTTINTDVALLITGTTLASGNNISTLGLAAAVQSTNWVDERNPSVKIGYDEAQQRLTFDATNSELGLGTGIGKNSFTIYSPSLASGTAPNRLGIPAFGSNLDISLATDDKSLGNAFLNKGPEIQVANKRFGANVEFDTVTNEFSIKSGTTGEALAANQALGISENQSASSIGVGRYKLTNLGGRDPVDNATAVGNNIGAGANRILGFPATTLGFTAPTGIISQPAVATGIKALVDMGKAFSVTEVAGENSFTVVVDGVSAFLKIPGGNYSGTTMALALQDRINAMEHPSTGTPIDGVKVAYNIGTNNLTFTTGTTGGASTIKIEGAQRFGLKDIPLGIGETAKIRTPVQATNDAGEKLYVSPTGVITADSAAFVNNIVEDFYPLFLDDGELTFNKAGELTSPFTKVTYDGLPNVALTVDFSKSTQYAQPFAAVEVSQDGYAAGRLTNLEIDNYGSVKAGYSNGTNVTLGKIIIANFNNNSGLKQIGNSTFMSTANSGDPELGEAAEDGFGNILSGSLERSNVDITEELVNLITAQRNYQAAAKAMETTTSMTQTIINIRL
jgi:flagellar hook protein FlgE